MITFKQFLEESRSAPLYHGANYISGREILESGYFKPLTNHNARRLLKNKDSNRLYGVSATRSLKFAKRWGQYKSGDDTYVIFEFDQLKLTTKYEIKPIQFWRGDARSRDSTGALNEYEEFILTNKPIPLSYVTKIHYFIDPDVYTIENRKIIIEKTQKMKKKYKHIHFVPISGTVEI